MPVPPPLTIGLYGEDGEFAVAEGHRDKQAFLAAVCAEAALYEGDVSVDDVEHAYWRDATRFDGEQAFEDRWKFWDAHAGNGEPITLLRLEP